MAYFVGDVCQGDSGIFISENAFEAASAGVGCTFLYLSPLTAGNTIITESGGNGWFSINATLGGSPMKYYVKAFSVSTAITNFAGTFPSATINKVSFLTNNLG